MWTLDNLLAAVLAVAGGTFYVVVYTLGLKRRTSANIVIGGAAGAFPHCPDGPAAHGSLGVGAWYLFAIVVVWTPPHFWSLAMLLRQQYEDADIPMLPSSRATLTRALQILVYSLGLAALTLVPGVTGVFGASYLVGAVLLGAVFCGFRVASVARAEPLARRTPVPLLAAVPGVAVRGRRRGRRRAVIGTTARRAPAPGGAELRAQRQPWLIGAPCGKLCASSA